MFSFFLRQLYNLSAITFREINLQLPIGYYWVSKTHVVPVFLYYSVIFSNKQTRKQPKSTEGNIWRMFFVDGLYSSCICCKLYCALLEWLQWAHAFYPHKWELLFPCLSQGEDGTITVQQSEFREKKWRERVLSTKLLSDKGSLFFASLSSLIKLTHLASDTIHLSLYIDHPVQRIRWVCA